MDLYEILGVGRGATLAQIRRAFQKRQRQLHPAVNPGDPLAEGRFATLAEAFAVLSDQARRADYDHSGHVPKAPEAVPQVGFEGFDFSIEYREGGAGFDDLFHGEGPPETPRAGEDLEQRAALTFEESLRGTSRKLHLMRYDRCNVCEGLGEVVLSPTPCPTCKGTGRVRASRRHMIFMRPCKECGARGVLGRRTCAPCGGEGRLMQSEWLDVTLPPGVGPGSHVRVPGCGNVGRLGGSAGDLVLTVDVESHSFYRREGEDLHCVLPVSLSEAALGAHVEVPTPDGAVTIEVPAGTQTGQRFRLRKRGVPRLGSKGRGDLFVEVSVRVPRAWDERSRELLRELGRLNPDDPRKDLFSQGGES
jgi:molecular chaperone DnaJ